MVQTPVLHTVTLNGRPVNVHACPWPLYRKMSADGVDTLDIVEEVVRTCVQPADGQELDVIGTSSRPQISRLFDLSVDDESAKPDF